MPDADAARSILEKLWTRQISSKRCNVDEEVDRLIRSKVVSVRFCLPTQLLGKLVDPKLDALCLQKGKKGDASQWDPRGFASKVIVPWVADNQNVLGTSTDPYVSKPLRIPRLVKIPSQVKNPDDWKLLYKILDEVETKNDPKFTAARLAQVLCSIKNVLAENSFEFPVPPRISLEETQQIVSYFLSDGSGGDRGLAVAAALFETFGKHFGIFSNVKRHAINASDTSTGAVADIECFDDLGDLRLAVEVKERSLTLTDVKSGLTKARKNEMTEFLFNAPEVRESDSEKVAELVEKAWNSGTSLYRISIEELIQVGLALAGSEARRDFIISVGEQLNIFNTQPINRRKWKDLLDSI